MTGPSVPQGTGGTLVERLTETLRPHQHAAYCIRKGHIPNGGYPAHLADVAAQTVAAWVREQEETVAAEWMRPEHGCDGSAKGCADACPVPAYEVLTIPELAAAALGVLLAGIEVEG